MYKFILIICFINIFYYQSVFSQNEKEEIVMLPVSSIGDISEESINKSHVIYDFNKLVIHTNYKI